MSLATSHLVVLGSVSSGALLIFSMFAIGFHRAVGKGPFFFDPQDTLIDRKKSQSNVGNKLPKSAENATFEPFLKHYLGITQLVFSVAAAAIAFGGSSSPLGRTVLAAKITLAWSICFGILFCGVLIWRYDEYAQNVQSYTGFWYSVIFASGMSCMICFVIGFLILAASL